MTSKNVLNGKFGKLYINNLEVAEVVSVESKISIERQDIRGFGVGTDSKMTSTKGEGTFVINKVYSRFEPFVREISKGHDVEFTLTFQISDPDAFLKQYERVVINKCWFNELPAGAFNREGLGQDSISFGFNPDNRKIQSEIKGY